MADKRLDSMNEYEQLKRKNRRRLVGASAMVVVAGIVFGAAVGSGSEEPAAEPAPPAFAQPETLTPQPIFPEDRPPTRTMLPTTPSKCRPTLFPKPSRQKPNPYTN